MYADNPLLISSSVLQRMLDIYNIEDNYLDINFRCKSQIVLL